MTIRILLFLSLLGLFCCKDSPSPVEETKPYKIVFVTGIAWAAGRETTIHKAGFTVDFVENYAPNNSGFGQKYKTGLRPEAM